MRRAIPLPPKLIYDHGGISIHCHKVHWTKGHQELFLRKMRSHDNCRNTSADAADVFIFELFEDKIRE
jgi:hypothetical protein